MNFRSCLLLPAALAVFLAVPMPAGADRTISSSFTQNGGTFSVSPAGTLYVYDATLTLNGVTTTGINYLTMQNGTMNVYGGSKVSSGFGAELGEFEWFDPWAVSTVNVVGSGSQWNAGNYMELGLFGNNGVVNIRQGGEVISGISILGGYYYGEDNETSGTGVVNVSDSGSRWHADEIWLGHPYQEIGSGTLNITNGGLVTSTSAEIGNFVAGWAWPVPGKQSSASVTGAGSRWETGTLHVGGTINSSNYESGALKVGDGGLVAVDDSFVVGKNGVVNVHRDGLIVAGESKIDHNGAVTVAGANAVWATTANLSLPGYNATLEVSSEGEVTATTIFASPHQLRGNGTISTKGVVLDTDLRFDSNAQEQQTLSFGNGGHLHFNLDGTGSLGVGYHGTGTLIITDGVQISSQSGYLGHWSSASNGTGDVIGAGSQWSNQWMYVGFNGTGALNVAEGGVVITGNEGFVGLNSGSTGTAAITGEGANWQIGNDLFVGEGGTGTLNAVESGTVTVGGASYLGYRAGSTGTLNAVEGGTVTVSGASYLGYRPGSTGTATVTGVDSRWQADSVLFVGHEGTGSLSVDGGGVVSSPSAYVGYENNSLGTVSVRGIGSEWRNEGDLYIGYRGDGSLSIADGGVVHSSSAYLARVLTYGKAAVTVSGAGSLLSIDHELRVTRAANVIDVHDEGMIVIGEAAGKLGAVVVGAGGVLHGAFNIIGDLIDAGGYIEPRRLLESSSSSDDPNAFSLNEMSSSVAPTIDGDFTQLAGGTLLFEIGGAGLFDQLVVTGDLSLGGLVQIDLVNGFVPGIGDQFTLFEVGGQYNGDHAQFVWQNAPSGFAFDGAFIDGSFTVSITAVPEPSTWLLAACGALALLVIRRRQG